jgi:hypothetical protein
MLQLLKIWCKMMLYSLQNPMLKSACKVLNLAQTTMQIPGNIPLLAAIPVLRKAP